MPTSITSTGITFPDATTQTTAAGGGGFSNMEVFTSPGTWTNPGSVTKVKVTVIGGGGGGAGPKLTGGTITAPSGGTSSFGAYCSATGGAGGYSRNYPGQGSPYGENREGGIGSGGQLNIKGGMGDKTTTTGDVRFATSKGGDTLIGRGGSCTFGIFNNQGSEPVLTIAGTYGGGGTWDSQDKQGGTGGGGGTAIEVITIPTSPVAVTVGATGTNSRDPTFPITNGNTDNFSNLYNVSGGDGVVIVEY